MIKHVVCYRLVDSSRENCENVRGMLLTMRGRIPQIAELFAGVDFLRSDWSYDVLLEVTFDNRDALEAYKSHPYHAETIKPFMHAAFASSVSVDCEY